MQLARAGGLLCLRITLAGCLTKVCAQASAGRGVESRAGKAQRRGEDQILGASGIRTNSTRLHSAAGSDLWVVCVCVCVCVWEGGCVCVLE